MLRLQDFRTGLVTAALIYALAWTPLFERIDTISADVLVMLRHAVFGQKHPPESSRVVVIAIDEQTYREPPFAGTPKAMWTPYIAPVLDSVLASGVAAIGFDVVFPTSVERYLPGFERPFLLSLRGGAREGRIVLGKVQHKYDPVSPYPAQSMVVGNERNIRSLNVVSDVDDVIRQVPLYFEAANGSSEASMALELAVRSLNVEPVREADGRTTLAGYTIPGSENNAMRVNFQGGSDIPTYSLADLSACAEKGDKEYFARHFSDKVVLFGAILDVEDRRHTGKRFAAGSDEGAKAPHCTVRPPLPAHESKVRRDTIPGVFIHAAAVNDLLRGDALREPGRPAVAALAGGVALLVVFLTLWLKTLPGVGAILALESTWTVGSVVALQYGVVLPLFSILGVISFVYGLMLGHRYIITDQQKHRIRRLFGLYLSPAVVSRMVDSDQLPELGGEMREVTVWFSDLANFTALSEGLPPNDLVRLMNCYFTVITDIIEEHGGFVDKYIGDAVVAVFGAPLDDPHHAGHAVAAALTAQARLEEMNAAGEFGERTIVTRTGINTGQAVVGNVGSSRRFNYTVMGDTVNLASRLEGANKAMGTLLLVSGETAEKLPDSIVLREVGLIRVKGRQKPVSVFEPLAMHGKRERRRVNQDERPVHRAFEAPEDIELGDVERALRLASLFAEAMKLYRDRRFVETAALLADCGDDPAAAKLLAHAEAKIKSPPPPEWDGVDDMREK